MQKLVHTGENHALNINACVKYTSLGTGKEQILGNGKKNIISHCGNRCESSFGQASAETM